MAAPKLPPGSLGIATGGAMANPTPFVWGSGGKPMSAEQARKHREIEAALKAKGGSPSNLGEGLNRVGEALLAVSYGKKAEQAETEGAAARKAVMDALLGNADPTMQDIAGAYGNDWVTSDPGASAILQTLAAQEVQQNDPLRQQQLQMGEIELNNARNPLPAKPIEVGGVLVDPVTFEPVFDSRTPSENGFTLSPGQQRFDAQGNPIATATPAEPDSPAAVDEYNWWAEQERAAGRTPMPYLDFVQAQKGSGLSITTPDGTVISQGGGKYGQTVGGGFGEAFMQIQNSALAAVQGMGTLDAMEQTLADPGFYSGFGGEQVLSLKQAAAAIGIDPEGVTSMETFNALSKKAALDAMGGSLGAGFSNADRGFVEQQVASLGTSPEGNRQLIQLQRKLAERKIEIAQLANQYAQAKGGIDAGFTDFLAQWSEANPLFPQTAQPGAGGTVPGQPNAAAPAGPQSQPPTISSPQEYDALAPGSPYLAPDGTIRTKGQ